MLESRINRKEVQEEDLITSTILGTMKYLPGDLFWYILRKACSDSKNLPDYKSNLIKSHFWPRYDPTDTTNSRFVEPDVILSFENFDVIIESKRLDDVGQYSEQWRNQIISILNRFDSQDIPENTDIFYIALGGNSNKKNEKLEFVFRDKNLEITINKCSWIRLLLAVEDTLSEVRRISFPIPGTGSIMRVLEDVVRGFESFGYRKTSFFIGMPIYKISYDEN